MLSGCRRSIMHQSVSPKRKASPLSLVQDGPGLRLPLSAIWWPVPILQTPLPEALWLGRGGKEGGFPPGKSSAWRGQVGQRQGHSRTPRSVRRIQPLREKVL